MKVSARTQYGLRILVQLATETEQENRVQGKEIAARQGINEPYLEQIMVSLKKAGLVRTIRGRNGGYLLAREPESISLLDVIEVFGGPLEVASSERHGNISEDPGALAASQAWQVLTDTLRDVAGGITLKKIIEADRASLTYVI